MGYFDEILHDKYPRFQPYTNPFGITLFLLNLLHSIWYYNFYLHPFWIILDVALGMLLADFVLGFGHMISDRLELSDEHHAVPANVLRRNFWCLNAENTVISFVLKILLMWVYPCNPIYIGAVIGSYNGSYHYWHHTPQNAPWIIKLLWKSGIVVDYKWHRLHHINHDDHYTLITSWSEPFIMWMDRTLTKYDILNARDR